VSELEVQLQHLRAVLPEERDVADLLRRVQAMATQSNLTIRGFAPHAVAKKQMHAEWPIGLQLEGTYHDLGAFLERVSRFPRIINVGGLSIKARTVDDGESTITADCTATTFVLLDAPNAVAAKPGAPATPGQPATAPKTE
jgi:type IV pilus assembly protein PilO